MRRFAIVAACAALALGGCDAVKNYVIDPTANLIRDPNTQLVLSSAKGFSQAVVCGLSTSAAGAQKVESYQYNGKPLTDQKGQDITAIVYAASSGLCPLLGGVVASASPVAVSTSTPVVTAAQ